MIVYPLENYNTFTDVAEATTKLTELGVGTEWGALDNAKKEQMLIMSASIIKAVAYIAENTCKYADAQIMLIQSDIINGGKYITTKDNTHAYKEAKVGSLQVKYNLDNDGKVLLPSIVTSMLSECLKNSDKPIAIGFNLA